MAAQSTSVCGTKGRGTVVKGSSCMPEPVETRLLGCASICMLRVHLCVLIDEAAKVCYMMEVAVAAPHACAATDNALAWLQTVLRCSDC